jgi:hypothetical protein
MGGTSGMQAEKCLESSLFGDRPLGRSRFEWENDIKIDVKEIEFGDKVFPMCCLKVFWGSYFLASPILNLRTRWR